MTRSFYWYQNICPCDLGLRWNWPLSGAFVFHKHILLKNIFDRLKETIQLEKDKVNQGEEKIASLRVIIEKLEEAKKDLEKEKEK